MSKASLKISDNLSLPLELAARTQCIFAQKGAGKTYAAGVQTEEMLAAGVQMCVLDPTGVWWGLQSSADGGKSPYEIIVMGGGHADVPLEPDAGEVIANFLVESGQSVILDVSQFESQAAQDRFALAMATKLYRLKAHDRSNIHIMLDEADQFCPMKPQKGQERLLHAWSLIVRLGRSRGLGLTAISNRPAAVHTDIRNNIDLLTCMRVTGPHDFKALREWTSIHATQAQAKEFLETVPALPNGEAFFWSPSWLGIFMRANVREKHTFDSSRTPKPGERAIEPKARRTPDLTKLTEQIKASVERAKAEDPKLLKQELSRLRTELQKAQQAKPAQAPVEKVKEVIKEVPVLKNGQLTRTEKAADRLEKTMERLAAESDKFRAEAAELRRMIAPAAAPRPAVAVRPVPVTRPVPSRSTRESVQREESSDGPLPKGERAVLTACAQYPEGAANDQLSVLTGYKRRSRDTYLQRLRERGFVDKVGDSHVATEAGLDALGSGFTPLPIGEALRVYWLGRLPQGERRVLEFLISVYPDAIPREQIDEATDYKRRSRDTYLQRLGARRLVEFTKRGEVSASATLFDMASA